MHTSDRSGRKTLSLAAGNCIQVIGIGLGSALVWFSAQAGARTSAERVAILLAGYGVLYFTTHALMHALIGRLLGMRFTHYSVGGSTHASAYPPVLRQVFAHLPFFAAHTDRHSLAAAHPAARAAMYLAGILGTVLFCTAAALFAMRAGVPGGSALFVFNGIWLLSSLIAEWRLGGDVAKAIGAFAR